MRNLYQPISFEANIVGYPENRWDATVSSTKELLESKQYEIEFIMPAGGSKPTIIIKPKKSNGS